MQPFAEVFPAANIRHVFVGQDAPGKGLYAKELRIPVGFELVSHAHPYDHLSVLASGTVLWSSGGQTVRRLRGPCAVTVEAGVEHRFLTLSDGRRVVLHSSD